jgi:hypothetical protein
MSKPYRASPYSGIGRLRLALEQGAILAREVGGDPQLLRAGYYPRRETIRRAIAVGIVEPAGDGLLPETPQSYRLSEGES